MKISFKINTRDAAKIRQHWKAVLAESVEPGGEYPTITLGEEVSVYETISGAGGWVLEKNALTFTGRRNSFLGGGERFNVLLPSKDVPLLQGNYALFQIWNTSKPLRTIPMKIMWVETSNPDQQLVSSYDRNEIGGSTPTEQHPAPADKFITWGTEDMRLYTYPKILEEKR